MKKSLIITSILLALLVIIFGIELIYSVMPWTGLLSLDISTLLALGGSSFSLVVTFGEWHRLITSVFLHASLLHIVLNCYALFYIGSFLERLIGGAWFLAIFFISGVGASLLSILLNQPNVISIGASGAIMGLFAAALVLMLRYPPSDERNYLIIMLGQVLVFSLIPIATGYIDYAGHLGGAIAGAIVASILLLFWPTNKFEPPLKFLSWFLCALGIAATIYGFYLISIEYTELSQAIINQ